MIDECLDYFTNKPVFNRILEGLTQKYKSLDKIGGVVKLSKLKDQDIEDLEGFFQKSYHNKKTVSISAKSFEKALKNTKFEEINLKDILLAFNDGFIESKKEEKEKITNAREEFFLELITEYKNTFSFKYLEYVYEQKNSDYYLILRKFNKNKNGAKIYIKNILDALNNLPIHNDIFESLPFFAAKVTKDPHYFDFNKEGYTLLRRALLFYLNEDEIKESNINNKKKHEREYLFYKYNICIDSLSNSILIYNIDGFVKGEEHSGMQGFNKMKEAYNITLDSISNLTEVSCKNKEVFVVENPSVFSELIKEENISVICVSGFVNISGFALLDKIIKSGSKIYYAGDFDPEGLIISDILKREYKDKLEFLNMDVKSYKKSISNVILSEKRLKGLNSVISKELQPVKNYMIDVKKAAYQEKLIFEYISFIRNK